MCRHDRLDKVEVVQAGCVSALLRPEYRFVPDPRSRMCGTIARTIAIAPKVLVSNKRRIISSEVVSRGKNKSNSGIVDEDIHPIEDPDCFADANRTGTDPY